MRTRGSKQYQKHLVSSCPYSCPLLLVRDPHSVCSLLVNIKGFLQRAMDTVADVIHLQDEVRGLIDRGLPVSSQSLPLSEAQSLDHVVYLRNEVSDPW